MVKTWCITGTSTGLGRLLTERLLERGDQVVATLRRPGALDELLVRHGNRLHVLTLDVTDTRAVRTVMADAFDRTGHIDEIGRAHVELQSLMRISYAVFCLKKKKKTYIKLRNNTTDKKKTN